MGRICYREDRTVTAEQLRALYDDAGWETVTRRSDAVLAASVAGSQVVSAAWDGERLVGLFRAITDGARCGHVLDLLVRRDYRGRGIGSELFRRGLAAMEFCDYISLLAEPPALSFYRRFGFAQHSDSMLLRRRVEDSPHEPHPGQSVEA